MIHEKNAPISYDPSPRLPTPLHPIASSVVSCGHRAGKATVAEQARAAVSWQALCVRAAGDPIGYDAEHAAECADLGCCFPPPLELAGLALFARLMSIVSRPS